MMTRLGVAGTHRSTIFNHMILSNHASRSMAVRTQASHAARWLENARLTDVLGMLGPSILQPGDTAIDATCGNGHDTLTLSRCVGGGGRVVGFDISAAALQATRRRLEEELAPEAMPELKLVHAGHETMPQHLGHDSAKLICFNLGYLPGSDKTEATRAGSSLAALSHAFDILQPGGLLSVMCYTGHPGGAEETDAIISCLSELEPASWLVTQLKLLNRPSAPLLCTAWKRVRK
ncbi:RRM10 [Auxenochlorella protothecoides x Auxenochlorella symbiontica]